jgi:hypothetical protein
MQDDIRRLHQLLKEGQCCASALVCMALERRGEDNPQLVQAVRGLCGGVQDGLLCGALTGAACMLNVVDPERANEEMVPELARWFQAEMGATYGGSTCADIVEPDPAAKAARCPGVVEATYRQAKEILKSYGHEWD